MYNYCLIGLRGEQIQKFENIFFEYPEFHGFPDSKSFEEGMNMVLKLQPELVIINLDSAYKENIDPFSFCKEIEEYCPKSINFVAVSQSTEYAYRALKNRFFDYIIEPYRELDIRKCILKLRKEYESLPKKTICLKSYKDYTLIELDNIIFLQAENNTTDFIMSSGKKVSGFKTLKSYESILPSHFIRIHHSYIVNSKYISRINFGKAKCFLHNHKVSLPFSRSYRKNLSAIENMFERSALSAN